MTAIRLIILLPALVLAAGQVYAAPPSGPVPLPRTRPAIKSTTGKETAPKAEVRTGSTAAVSLASTAPHAPPTASNPAAPVRVNIAPQAMPGPAVPAPSVRLAPALAMATSSTTSPLDLAAVKQAVDLVHKGRIDEATNIESTISDPLARKLVEWLILRSDDSDADFSRYAAFIAANPSWPSIVTLRRRA